MKIQPIKNYSIKQQYKPSQTPQKAREAKHSEPVHFRGNPQVEISGISEEFFKALMKTAVSEKEIAGAEGEFGDRLRADRTAQAGPGGDESGGVVEKIVGRCLNFFRTGCIGTSAAAESGGLGRCRKLLQGGVFSVWNRYDPQKR